MNYNVTKEVKQVIYAPGTVKRLSIAVAVNKILTDPEKDEVKALVQSAAGIDLSRGDVISVSGLQFEGASMDKKVNEDFTRQYQREQTLEMITTSIIPLFVVLILGLFSLVILKSFISKIPAPVRRVPEKKVQEETIARAVEEEEAPETAPALQFTRTNTQTQREQSINELNEAIMSAPEDAAKLLTSFIRE